MSAPAKNTAPKNAPAAPAQKDAAPSFTVKERWLVGRLGLSRDTLRDLRAKHLQEGTHWALQGNTVLLTEGAVEIIAGAAKIAAKDVRPLGLLTFPGWDGVNVILKVWRTFPRNPSIMECYYRDRDPRDRRNIVRVRVKDTSNFVQHMEVPARLIPGHSDFYECTRPAPRSRGRW